MNMLDGKTSPTEATHCCKSPGCKSTDHTRSCKYFKCGVQVNKENSQEVRQDGQPKPSRSLAFILGLSSSPLSCLPTAGQYSSSADLGKLRALLPLHSSPLTPNLVFLFSNPVCG